jgi:hypothetical protein
MINPPQRSPRQKVGGLFHFGRMLDKIRAHQRGELPEEYHANLGIKPGLDGQMCAFLNVEFSDLYERVKADGSDEELLAWCHERGAFHPTKGQKRIWNEFARKVGWNDIATDFMERVKAEEGLARRTDLATTFDVIDFREGRKAAPEG